MTEIEHFPKPKKPKAYPAAKYPWLVHYDLAYDDGGDMWTGYYRGRRRALIAIFWHRFISSWGGSADLMRRTGR